MENGSSQRDEFTSAPSNSLVPVLFLGEPLWVTWQAAAGDRGDQHGSHGMKLTPAHPGPDPRPLRERALHGNGRGGERAHSARYRIQVGLVEVISIPLNSSTFQKSGRVPTQQEGSPPIREEGFPPVREEGFPPVREGVPKGGRGQPRPFCPRSAGMSLIGQNGLVWASLASHNAESIPFSFSRWSDKSLGHSTHVQGIYRNLYNPPAPCEGFLSTGRGPLTGVQAGASPPPPSHSQTVPNEKSDPAGSLFSFIGQLRRRTSGPP